MQNRRSRSQSFVIHAVIFPVLSVITSFEFFRPPRPGKHQYWFTWVVVNHHPRSMRTRTGGTPVVFTKFLRTGHKHVSPSTIGRKVVHRQAQSKYGDYSALYGPLPHGDFVSCRVLYSSLFFVPRKNSPLIHLQATLQSPHNCTVGPSLQMWTVKCSGPKSLGVLSLIFFSISFLLPCLCTVANFILLRMNVTNLYLSSNVLVFLFSCFHLSFLSQPSVAILSHAFPRLCHPHLCFHLVRFSGSSSITLV